jgi:hypothetical protein
VTIFSNSIEIHAPIEKVFTALCDLPAYKNWHPSVISAVKENNKDLSMDSNFEIGDWLVLDLGNKKRSVKVPVLVTQFENNTVLEWQGSLFKKTVFRNLFLVRHLFYLEEIGNGVTKFTNEEEFNALLSFSARLAKNNFISGYQKVNNALKQYCEKY